ncbi:MAG TPA: NnrU family protein [Myxococcota bacterium]|nr:NnrU family protein [Myxococcota bacterium]
MDATIWLVVLWLAFAATHMGMSSPRIRPRLVGALGERAFAGVYSLVALAIFVPLVRIYFAHKHEGAFLWSLGGVPGLRYAVYVGMALCFVLLVGGLARPSPSSMAAGPAEVRGVQRVTRHPVFMAAGLYGLLHLLVVSVSTTELAFFGGFPLFAVVGSLHQDARKLAAPGSEAYRRFCAETSLLPDPRGIAGALREVPVPAAIGIAATAALRFFHPTLFGP